MEQQCNSEQWVPGTMTGQGRTSYGRSAYRGGRGQGRGAGRTSKPTYEKSKTNNNTSMELKFAPHYSSKVP